MKKSLSAVVLAAVVTLLIAGNSYAIDTVPLPEKSPWSRQGIDTVPMPSKMGSKGYVGTNGDSRLRGTTLPVPDRTFRRPGRGVFRSPNTFPQYKVGYKVGRGLLSRPYTHAGRPYTEYDGNFKK